MPTQRSHGGAALQHIPLNLPAFNGVNLQSPGAILGPEWATRLVNTVLDESNRVATRKGVEDLNDVHADLGTGGIDQMFEYQKHDGTFVLLAVSGDGSIWASADAGLNWTDATGTATVTDTHMQFVNFNDEVYAWQRNGGVLYSADGLTFSDLAVAGIPTGSVAASAYGRVWAAAAGGTDLRYSALLDASSATAWDENNNQDTGGFDLKNVWQGTDTIQAIIEFNGQLVVFGERNILLWSDGSGSEIGLDPINMYVVDTIPNIGCIARDSVLNVDGDLWFLSESGIISLDRLLVQRSNPVMNLSQNIRDQLSLSTRGSARTDIKAFYSPVEKLYLLCLPSPGDPEQGEVFAMDTRGKLDDGTARCVGVWTGMIPTAGVLDNTNRLLFGARVLGQKIGQYGGYQDNGESYFMEWESAWFDLDNPYLKFPKRFNAILYPSGAEETINNFKWGFDFDPVFKKEQVRLLGNGTTYEWGIGEWAESEWGSPIAVREVKVGGRGSGEYVKVGMSVVCDNTPVSIQQLALYFKLGRLK